MNVLSLFDGISCGQVALNRAGIKYDNYFASEIDKHAIEVTQNNYPDTIQLGDITKWREWNLPKIDLLIGGSTCQGFSFAGKQLNFDDPRSKLFFEYVDILNELKPVYFLLENVMMKKEYRDVITQELGVYPIFINSSLVSAQERKRMYWTNIDVKGKPKDKKIYLKDVIEGWGVTNKRKSYCIDSNYIRNANLYSYIKKARGTLIFDTLETIAYFQSKTKKELLSKEERDKNCYRRLTPTEVEKLQTLHPSYTNILDEKDRCKCLGNGWTVDVIVHIFSFLNLSPKPRVNIQKQLSLF